MVSGSFGLFSPAGTPKSIVNKLNSEIIKIMQQPNLQTRLESEGAKFKAMTPEAFAVFQKNEALKWAKTIKDSGITPE